MFSFRARLEILTDDHNDVKFITLRKRNKTLLNDTVKIPESQWTQVKLPIPKRKHQKFLVHESEVYLNINFRHPQILKQ